MLSAAFVLSACSVSGTVTDTKGVAIEGANVQVVFEDGEEAVTTNSDGEYSVSAKGHSGTVEVTVSKVDHISSTRSTEIGRTGVVLDFLLVRDVVAPITGNISGTIRDIAGNGVSGAIVAASGSSVATDENGIYTLSVEVSDAVSVTVDANNYAQNSRVVAITEDATTALDMVLVAADKVETFDVTAGADISVKGATVALAGASIVNSDGSTYSGNVVAQVSFNQVTTLSGREAFPGDYIGLQENGEEAVLQSYGFIDVTLNDVDGNTLKLADGATATLTYPMDENIDNTPATIPLWYYDTVRGIWVEDGVATYDADTNSYVGQVSHFTTWNLDAKFDGATIEGCVEDVNGVRIQSATLVVSTPGVYKKKNNQDANGEFKFINAPSGLEFTIQALVGDMASSVQTVLLAAGEEQVMPTCLVVDQDAPTEHTVTGKVVYSDGSPVAYSSINLKNGANSIGYAYTNENGEFTSEKFLTPENGKVTVDVSVYIENQYIVTSQTFTLNSVSDTTNLGTFEIKVTRVTGCLVRPNGSTDFTHYNRKINLDDPYADSYYNRANVSEDGTFSFVVAQNNAERTAYAFTDDNNFTKKFSFITNVDTIDMSGTCIVLEEAIDVNKTVSANIVTSDADVFMKVGYSTYSDYEYPSEYGEETLIEEGTSGTFDLTKNGVYTILQSKDDYDERVVDGTISIIIDGVVHTLEIPLGSETYNAWAGFAIEVYQGEIRVIELNKKASYGKCERAC